MAIEGGRPQGEWGARARTVTWTMFAVVSVLALGFLVQANMIGQRHFGRWDMTDDAQYSLTEETQKDLRALTRDVDIYVVGPMAQAGGDESVFHAFDMTLAMLKEFQSYTTRIKVIPVTMNAPDRDALLNRIGTIFKTVDQDMIYLVTYKSTAQGTPSDPVMRDIPLRECFSGDAVTGKILDFHAELVVMIALSEIAGDEKRIVYYTTSHGEVARQAQNRMMLSFQEMALYVGARLNLEFRELPSFAAVPGDCDVLMIGFPDLPFSKPEAEAVDDYLKRGGRLFVCTKRASALTDALKNYGIDICGDVLTPERGQIVVPCYFAGTHPIVRYQAERRRAVALFDCASVRKAVATRGESSLVDLLITGQDVLRIDRELYEKNAAQRPIEDEPKAVPVALAAEQSSTSKAPKKYRIVAAGWPVFIDRLPDAEMPEFTLNTFKWLLARESRIAAPPKRSERSPLKMEKPALDRLFWITVFGFPSIGIVLGLMAWGFRRK